MGGKSSKDFDFDTNNANKQELLAKFFKNKKLNADDIGDEYMRKQQVKQSMYGGNANNARYRQNEAGGDSAGKNYVKTPSSRLQIDVNDPLLISTLPAPLTSVITENQNQTPLRQHQHYKPAPPHVIPPPLPAHGAYMRHHGTFNVGKMHHFNHEQSDPWRNAAQKMAQNNLEAAQHQQFRQTNKPTKSLLLQELLECPICMNRYDNPHVLPCQHTFCKSCIVTLKSNSRTDDNKICCPICRECHQLPVNGVDNLPANYTMKRLIELEQMAAEKKAAAAAAAVQADLLNRSNAKRIAKAKPPRPIVNKLLQGSDASFSSEHSFVDDGRDKYSSRYQKHSVSHHHEQRSRDEENTPIKLILLCHSSEVEARESDEHNYDHIDNLSHSSDDSRIYSSNRKRAPSISSRKYNEIYEDEYGICKTFSKIGVHFADHIGKIKSIIEEKFEIPFEEQLIVYKDKILKHDHRQLRDYHIRNYSRLHVFDKRDVKKNLDDIDPYSVDGDFFKELALNCNLGGNRSMSGASFHRSNYTSSFKEREGDRANKLRNSFRKPPPTPQHHYHERQRKERDEHDNDEVYETRSQFVFNHKQSPILSDFKKHSVNYRRVRKLDELIN